MFRSYDDWKASPPDETGRFHACPVCLCPCAGIDGEPCSRACDEIMHAEDEEPVPSSHAA